MQTDSMFRIMSMTKPVVGAPILMMMEEGKVRLTDPVSKFIPELKGLQVAVSQPAQGPPPAAGTPAEPRYYTVPADHEITVRELLTHTSGLVSGTDQQQRQPQGRAEGQASRSPTTCRGSRRRRSSSSRARAGPTARRPGSTSCCTSSRSPRASRPTSSSSSASSIRSA